MTTEGFDDENDESADIIEFEVDGCVWRARRNSSGLSFFEFVPPLSAFVYRSDPPLEVRQSLILIESVFDGVTH